LQRAARRRQRGSCAAAPGRDNRGLSARRAVLIVAAVSVAFVVLEIVQNEIRRAAGGGGDDTLVQQLVGVAQPWALFALLVRVIVVFVRRFPRPLALHVPAAVAFAIVHMGLLTLVHWLREPAAGAFGRSLFFLLGFYLLQDVVVYAAVAAVVLVVSARRELRDRALDAARLQASLAEARLHALRGQIHPHFLFNAMNSVAMLVREQR